MSEQIKGGKINQDRQKDRGLIHLHQSVWSGADIIKSPCVKFVCDYSSFQFNYVEGTGFCPGEIGAVFVGFFFCLP